MKSLVNKFCNVESLLCLFLFRYQIIRVLDNYYIYALLLIMAGIYIIKNKIISKPFIIINFIIINTFFLNIIFFKEYRIEIFNIVDKYVMAGAIGILLISFIKDGYNKLFDIMNSFAWINLVLVFYIKNTQTIGYMDLGYFLLQSLLIFYCTYRINNEKIYIVPSIILGGYIFLYGARGAILSFGILILIIELYMLFNKINLKLIIKHIILIITISTLFYGVVNGNVLKSIFYKLYEKGVYSYSLAKYIGNDDSFMSGRENIYKEAIDDIKKNIIVGNGVGSYQYKYNEKYIHNVLLDVTNEFGILGGLILILIFLRYIYITFKDNNINKCVLFVFLGMSMKLLTSSQYWSESSFWIIIYITFAELSVLKLNRIKGENSCHVI